MHSRNDSMTISVGISSERGHNHPMLCFANHELFGLVTAIQPLMAANEDPTSSAEYRNNRCSCKVKHVEVQSRFSMVSFVAKPKPT